MHVTSLLAEFIAKSRFEDCPAAALSAPAGPFSIASA